MKQHKIFLTLALIVTTVAVARLNITASLFYFGIIVAGVGVHMLINVDEV